MLGGVFASLFELHRCEVIVHILRSDVFSEQELTDVLIVAIIQFLDQCLSLCYVFFFFFSC